MINNANKIVLALNIATRQKLQISNERLNIQILNWEINARLNFLPVRAHLPKPFQGDEKYRRRPKHIQLLYMVSHIVALNAAQLIFQCFWLVELDETVIQTRVIYETSVFKVLLLN